MIIFSDQKTLSLKFIITSVSLHHYVSTKIFVKYLFLESLVSFDLFWRQKQPPEVLCKKGVLKNFLNFTEDTCAGVSFELETLKPATLLKNKLHHSCFPVNIAKFSRIAFCMGHIRWLHLKMV